jgi:hypothetical protein
MSRYRPLGNTQVDINHTKSRNSYQQRTMTSNNVMDRKDPPKVGDSGRLITLHFCGRLPTVCDICGLHDVSAVGFTPFFRRLVIEHRIVLIFGMIEKGCDRTGNRLNMEYVGYVLNNWDKNIITFNFKLYLNCN